jgi:hypothetical protein
MFRVRGIVSFGLLCLLLLPDASAAGQSSAEFHWQRFVPQGNAIEIKGVNGDVTAMPATGSEAEVMASRRGRRNNPDDVKIEVVEHSGGVTICAVYPSRDGDRPNECRPGTEGRMNVQNNDVQVAFTVRVPAGVRFIGRTVNGDVEAESLAATVSANTVNGSVTISTSSYGEASTVNGSVRATLGRGDWTETLTFKTVNGSVTLALPGDTSADVHVATVNGDISTDFPLTVRGRFSPRRLDGTIGAGGRALVVETVNGSVTLQRR